MVLKWGKISRRLWHVVSSHHLPHARSSPADSVSGRSGCDHRWSRPVSCLWAGPTPECRTLSGCGLAGTH